MFVLLQNGSEVPQHRSDGAVSASHRIVGARGIGRQWLHLSPVRWTRSHVACFRSCQIVGTAVMASRPKRPKAIQVSTSVEASESHHTRPADWLRGSLSNGLPLLGHRSGGTSLMPASCVLGAKFA